MGIDFAAGLWVFVYEIGRAEAVRGFLVERFALKEGHDMEIVVHFSENQEAMMRRAFSCVLPNPLRGRA